MDEGTEEDGVKLQEITTALHNTPLLVNLYAHEN